MGGYHAGGRRDDMRRRTGVPRLGARTAAGLERALSDDDLRLAEGGHQPATRQKENDFGAVFTLTTACSGGACVATVVDGPAPSNPTIPPQPTRYTWNGAEWATTYDWVWDCFLGDGYQKQWSPATSWAFYTPPQPDGSLRGTWHTDIASGPCRGSVVMPVSAVPA